MMDELLFLKPNILQSRQNDNTGKNVLKLLKIDKQNEFLFQKNIASFIEMTDFLSGRDDVFVISGFSLSGKSLLASVISQMVTERTIFHSFYCTEASTLDDLLLSFFETMKIYAQKKLVFLPKIDTTNFQERINIYLTKCENPIVILLDGLDKITNKENKDEIMYFLSHVVNLENIKLVLTTRAFDVADLKNIHLRLDTVILKPLRLEDLKEYCLTNVISSEGIEDFYKKSRGHNFNLFFTMNYIQPTNLTIQEFLAELELSKKTIDELVISKTLSLIPPSYDNLLWIIALSDFGMPLNNLLSVADVSEDQINFLVKKGVIEVYNGCVYLKDYFKSEILKSIEPLAKINIIKGIVKFLEAQLPVKPALREVKLSRVTLRNEITRLNNILNKSVEKKTDKSKASYMTILGYSRQFKTNWDGFDEIIMPKTDKPKEDISKTEDIIEPVEEISVQDSDFELPKEKNSALSFAKMLKNKYNYADALIEYADALEEAMSIADSRLLIEILKDIAECYFKIGDYQNSIENYGKAHEVAKKENFVDICYEILLEIAEIYKSTYKKELAVDIYRDIISVDDISPDIKLHAELNLFELEFSKLKSNEIINKYFELLKKAENNVELKSKIYFRLGFLYDNASSFDNAKKYYEKSIETCSNHEINENLSSCYYNLAQIYYYQKDYEKALSLYMKTYAIDEIKRNFDGMFLTTKRIAKTYEKKKSDLAQKYYEKALDIAKNMNDNYPVACAIIDLGDYYYRQKNDMQALKVYLSALKVLANQLTHENEMAIKDRISDLKVRMGKDVVDDVIRGFS